MSAEDPFVCDVCGKNFDTVTEYVADQNDHVADPGKVLSDVLGLAPSNDSPERRMWG